MPERIYYINETYFMKTSCVLFLLMAIISPLNLSAKDIEISGKVTDSDDKDVLVGVTVWLKGTTRGVYTDMDGKYTINAALGDTLVFSYIGCKSQEIKVEQTAIDIEMHSDMDELDVIIKWPYPSRPTYYASPDIKTITVSGIVTDSCTNEPVPNVNVMVKGTDWVVVSDTKGRYSIGTLKGVTLVFSSIDYDTKEVQAVEVVLNISLDESIR